METARISAAQTSCCALNTTQQAEEPSRFQPFVEAQEENWQVMLHVEGIACAKCIWAIESALQKEQGITEARVNMSTSRLVIRWQGDANLIDRFAAIVEKLGYQVKPFTTTHSKGSHEETKLLRCMAVAGFAMGNIMLISAALWSSDLQSMGSATRELLHWLSALIALPAVLYAGRPFFASALGALKARRTNMDVPISLGVTLACTMSLIETMQGGEHAYFDSAVMLLFFLLIGRWLDVKARGKARQHATALLELLQGTATRLLSDGRKENVMIHSLQAGDRVVIAAGEKIPTDVMVLEGSSDSDSSLVTGETLPKPVKQGDMLYGGTLNLSAPLICEVVQASEHSLLSDIIRLMEKAEQGRAHYVRLADKAARYYTPIVHSLAAIAFLGWISIGGMAWQDALMIAITTLIITCPCALALAVPVVQVLAVAWLMKRGVLVKSADALERLNGITTVIFDKTGTLTYGEPVPEITAEAKPYLTLAASLADYSKHPLSRALSKACNAPRLHLEQAQEVAGKGITALLEGKRLFLGKDSNAAENTYTSVMLQVDGKAVAHFRFTDDVRQDAKATVTAFRQAGISPLMLSGDRLTVVQLMAKRVGVNAYEADMLPDTKLRCIRELQSRGEKVLMVGDGLNDAPALAQADISMSPATGMDITQNTADMVFQGESLLSTFQSWQMAQFSTQLVRQNFALTVLYNCCAIPLAVAGYVTPLVAAVAMSSSSLLVIGNAFRIKFFKG